MSCFRFRLPWFNDRRKWPDPPSRSPQGGASAPHRRLQISTSQIRRAGSGDKRHQEADRCVASAIAVAELRRSSAKAHRQHDLADHAGQAGAEAAQAVHRHSGR